MRASQMRRRASREQKANVPSMSLRVPMTSRTAQTLDDDDKTYSITELDQQTRDVVVDHERDEMYNSSYVLSDLLSEDWGSLNRFCNDVGIEYRNDGYSDYDYVRCVDDTGECHAETVSDLLQMTIYDAKDDDLYVGIDMAEHYNEGLKKVRALQQKAKNLADSPEMDRLEDMGFFNDDRLDTLDTICYLVDEGYTEDVSDFSEGVSEFRGMSTEGMNDGDIEVVMSLCDRLNDQMTEIFDEYNETYQSVCQDALDNGIQDIEAQENYLTSYNGIVEELESEDARFTSDGIRVAVRRHKGMRASKMRKRNRTGSVKRAQAFLCDQVADTIDTIKLDAPYEDYDALSEAVDCAMDDECIYTYNVRALAEHYDAFPSDSELMERFWDQFCGEVWENIDEDELIKDSSDDDDDHMGGRRRASKARRRSRRIKAGRYDGFGTVSSSCGRGRKRSRRVR